MSSKKTLPIIFIAMLLNGCVAHKLVSTPIRVGGAIASTIPVLGKVIDKAAEKTAEVVDEVPI